MGLKEFAEVILIDAELHENPLVPNRKLRQMYVAMVEARLLDEHIAGLKVNKGPCSTRGEEACRVSTAIDLGPGDVVSDSQAGVVMNLLAGEDVSFLLGRVKHAKDKRVSTAEDGTGTKQLPWIKDAGERLRLAMGVALAFRMSNDAKAVVAYVPHAEVCKGEWRRILVAASQLELPIFFVVLPEGRRRKKKPGFGDVAKRAAGCGVPGMVVDANDAVALYRVTQETLGRIRGGGGPVLVECVAYAFGDYRGRQPLDPVAQMKNFLQGRKIATEPWLENAGESLKGRIAAGKT